MPLRHHPCHWACQWCPTTAKDWNSLYEAGTNRSVPRLSFWQSVLNVLWGHHISCMRRERTRVRRMSEAFNVLTVSGIIRLYIPSSVCMEGSLESAVHTRHGEPACVGPETQKQAWTLTLLARLLGCRIPSLKTNSWCPRRWYIYTLLKGVHNGIKPSAHHRDCV